MVQLTRSGRISKAIEVGVQFDRAGLRELQRNVKSLSTGLERSILRTALRRAARPVRDGARQRAPRLTGALRRSIGIRISSRRPYLVTARIGVRQVGPFAQRHTDYSRVIELGTSTRAAKPFLRPAFAHAQASGILRREFVAGFNDAVRRRIQNRVRARTR